MPCPGLPAVRSCGVLGDLPDALPGVPHAQVLDALFTCLAAGVYATDHVSGRGGRLLAVNPQCAALLGYEMEEMLGASVHALVHHSRADGSLLPVEACALLAVAEDGAPRQGQDLFWRRDGTPLPVAWTGAPLLRDGVVVGTVVAFTDDTDQRAASEARERELVREHETAVALQRALLTSPPDVPGLDLEVRYLPGARGAEVGGDWYDALVEADGSTLVVVGDVVGHDAAAAAAMGQLRALLRSVAHVLPEAPAALLTRVERAAEALGVSVMASVVVVRVGPRGDRGERHLTWSNAGHPPGLVLRADGSPRWLPGPHDLLLGVDVEQGRHDTSDVLADGETLLLFTDGLVERRGADLDVSLDVMARSAGALVGRPLPELLDGLVEAADEDGHDDVVLLALRSA